MPRGGASPQALDLVLRIPLSAGLLADIIAVHQEIAERFGAVWIGIFKGLSAENAEKLNRDSNRDDRPYLYIIQYGKETFTGFRAKIIQLRSTPPWSEGKLIPGYYEKQGITRSIGLWVKIGGIEPVSGERLHRLRIASTDSAVLNAMHRSMLTVALVYEAAA